MIEFRVYSDPVAKGRPRFARRGGFIATYTPKKTKDAENNFLAQAVQFRPEKPLEGALEVNMAFSRLKPKSKPKKIVHCITKPDLDNFQKMVLDSLNGVFWHDDAQIIRITAEKKYGESAYTDVKIKGVKNEDI